MIHMSFVKHHTPNKNSVFLLPGKKNPRTQENVQSRQKFHEDNVLDDSEVCKGLPDASLVLFPESKEENNFCASEDF